MASLRAKQGGSFAFCLMPVPEVAVLEASPVFLASAALGPVMHHKSSFLWRRGSNLSFPGGCGSIGLWLLQWQSYWCLLESTPRGPCWWILWTNSREFSVKAAFIYWVLNIHNCYGSCWGPQQQRLPGSSTEQAAGDCDGTTAWLTPPAPTLLHFSLLSLTSQPCQFPLPYFP